MHNKDEGSARDLFSKLQYSIERERGGKKQLFPPNFLIE